MEAGAELTLTNVHYHLGAEHKTDEIYDSTLSETFDRETAHGRALSETPRPGFMCPVQEYTAEQLAGYNFSSCKGMEVGKTFEFHFVFSSAGREHGEGDDYQHLITDGLGSAANGRGLLNPMIIVRALSFLVLNDDEFDVPAFAPGGSYDQAVQRNVNDGVDRTLLRHFMDQKDVLAPEATDLNNFVRYSGSTTGETYDNEVCSPYTVSWHVNTKCLEISAKSIDDYCKIMDKYGVEKDLGVHGSRKLVDAKYVVPPKQVYPGLEGQSLTLLTESLATETVA